MTPSEQSYSVTLVIRTIVRASSMRCAVEDAKGLVTREMGLFPHQFETLRFEVEGCSS